MTTPVHTDGMCRLTDRRRGLWAEEGQMFPCRHRGEMFAVPALCLPGSPQSHQLAAHCSEPPSAGERNWGPEKLTRTHRPWRRDRKRLRCVARLSLSPVRCRRFSFIPQLLRPWTGGLVWSRWRPDWMSELPLRRLTLHTDHRHRISFYRTCTQQALKSARRHLFLTFVSALQCRSVLSPLHRWKDEKYIFSRVKIGYFWFLMGCLKFCDVFYAPGHTVRCDLAHLFF